MKRIPSILLALLFTIFLPIASNAVQSDYVEGEVLVLMKGSSVSRLDTGGEAREVIRRRTLSLAEDTSAADAEAFVSLSTGSGKTFARLRSKNETTEAMIERLKKNPDVLGVGRNYKRYALEDVSVTPNDTSYSLQYALPDIGAPQVWRHGTGSSEVVVGIIDTGLIYDHPDLKDNVYTFAPSFWEEGWSGVHGVWYSKDFVDDAGNKVSGTIIGGSAKTTNNWQNDPASVGDVLGHGSHVAGIIGAVGNNNVGVAGVNWKVKLLPVNVFSYTSSTKGFAHATDEDIMNAMDFLLEVKNSGINLRVVNMSIGGWSARVDQNTDPMAQSLKGLSDAGIVVVIAAGNEKQNIDSPSASYSGKLPYPAAYKFKNTITVGALERPVAAYTKKADYSNYSSSGKWVDIFAPGSDIYSTVRSSALVATAASQEIFDASGYKSIKGTSMASPMVAGSAALLCSLYPEKDATEIKSMLLAGANGSIAKSGYSKYGALCLPDAYVYKTLVSQDAASPSLYTVQGAILDDPQTAELEILENAANIPVAALRNQVEATEDGLILKYNVISSVIGSLLEKDQLFYTPSALPMFKITDVDMAGKLYAVEFSVEGKRLGSSLANLRVTKVSSTTNGRTFTWAGSGAEFANGTYTIMDQEGNILASNAIDASATYRLVVFLTDNGGYDLDSKSNAIVDPVILYTVQENKQSSSTIQPTNPTPTPTPTPTPNPGTTGGGGGGGCASVPGIYVLLLLVPLLIFLEKRKAE